MNVEVIAELGQGFEGSLKQAKLLIKAASAAGADAAKFQLIYADELSTPDYEHYQLFSSLEMSDEDWMELKATCDSSNIELMFDIFGARGLELVEKIGVQTVKLHATDINNIGFLKSLAQSGLERIMVGAGGAYASEIAQAIDLLSSKIIVLFHGYQGYPTPLDANQLSRLNIWNSLYGKYDKVSIGFHDHVDPEDVSSISLPAFAVGMGASVLEKHLTLGRCMELEDFEAALNPDQFKVFVNSIRDLSIAFGKSSQEEDFGMSDGEKSYRRAIRRHVVTVKPLEAGHQISETDVVLKRTSSKDVFTDIRAVYNKTSKKPLQSNCAIVAGDIE